MAEDSHTNPTLLLSESRANEPLRDETLLPVAVGGLEATANDDDSRIGAFIGRYQIIRQLGKGGFGTVYLARDSDLDRLVAIKLPRAAAPEDQSFRKAYLLEARTLASLDHPFIVPIYDFGIVPDGRCFVVSKYIEGRDLAKTIANALPPLNAAARILADVAEALHHVHRSKIVHRDIKPANLLLEESGRVYVADFGLAFREDPSQGMGVIAGTPNYMSPEQVRGEGHLIDGRSDQFSLGVVMYELLTGERPFAGGTADEVMKRILATEPIPPKQRNPRIPSELSRVCLKLLSKLASQRYSETIDLANDLREWLRQAAVDRTENDEHEPQLHSRSNSAAGLSTNADQQPTVVTRGLRAFTRADAYFFLNLLPGNRDRDGLPVILSHWKNWVATRNDFPDLQRVGVISGPTGCGKSSLIRAGLLPLFDSSVVSVLIEASPDVTERQLLEALDRRWFDTPTTATLSEKLTAIRRGAGVPQNKTLLLVIDQFEQWLHSHPNPIDSELVRAIRQCDGVRVKCLVLIRDDFWLALSRFMEAIESPLQLGNNATMVDLFDQRHARKVLTEFGRSFNQLPQHHDSISRDQEKFLDGAIQNLSIDGKIVPVHLTLFAEMVKSREWTSSTLRTLGGSTGIGARFLNESFSASYAPVSQRSHEDGARRILQALLPDLGTEIKARRRARTDLQSLSGYKDDRSQFDQLMTILESELKLVSATQSHDHSRSELSVDKTEVSSYQLSHDFLVPSIREWLTAKQRESWTGRLHQRLSELAGLWNQQHDKRFLPNHWEWAMARCCLSARDLTPSEAEMMAKSDRRSIRDLTLGVIAAVALFFVGNQYNARNRAETLVTQLSTAEPSLTPGLVDQLYQLGDSGKRAITDALSSIQTASDQGIRLQVAQLKWSSDSVDTVYEHLLDHSPIESVPVYCQALQPYAGQLKNRCWTLLETATNDESFSLKNRNYASHFRAAQLLAVLDPPGDSDTHADANTRWDQSAIAVADMLVQECARHPDHFASLADSLKPVSEQLIPRLAINLGVREESVTARFAISLLAAYLESHPELQTRLCLDASDWQKELIIPERSRLMTSVLWEVVRNSENVTGESEKSQNARSRALATALLLSQPTVENSEELWHVLQHAKDCTARSELIRLLAPFNVPLTRVFSRLRFENDNGILAALLIAVGDYSKTDPAITDDVRRLIASLYRDNPNSGVHSAAEWLIGQWGDVDSFNTAPPEPTEVNPLVAGRQWLRINLIPGVNSQTMVVIDGISNTAIRRKYLMATHEVTVEQFLTFNPGQHYNSAFSPFPSSPINVIEWPEAIAYCNWLSKTNNLREFYPADTDDWIPTDENLRNTGFRLPTDAEWEFASRGETQTHYFFGTDPEIFFRYGWNENNHREYFDKQAIVRAGSTSEREYLLGTMPVGLLRPNDFGLFDMYGNICEWCNDASVHIPGERQIRGGSVGTFSHLANSDTTASHSPRAKYNSMGFRVVRTLSSE